MVPSLTPTLEQALAHYQIEIQEISPGFWQAKTLFPLYLVAYNHLPLELPYSQLKLFIKSGQPLQQIFQAVLESEQRQSWLEAMLTVMELIHPLDSQEVLKKMGLAAERQELRKTMLELVKPDLEQELAEREQQGKLEGKRETARQMKADGLPVARICKYTGLSAEDVAGL